MNSSGEPRVGSDLRLVRVVFEVPSEDSPRQNHDVQPSVPGNNTGKRPQRGERRPLPSQVHHRESKRPGFLQKSERILQNVFFPEHLLNVFFDRNTS